MVEEMHDKMYEVNTDEVVGTSSMASILSWLYNSLKNNIYLPKWSIQTLKLQIFINWYQIKLNSTNKQEKNEKLTNYII